MTFNELIAIASMPETVRLDQIELIERKSVRFIIATRLGQAALLDEIVI